MLCPTFPASPASRHIAFRQQLREPVRIGLLALQKRPDFIDPHEDAVALDSQRICNLRGEITTSIRVTAEKDEGP